MRRYELLNAAYTQFTEQKLLMHLHNEEQNLVESVLLCDLGEGLVKGFQPELTLTMRWYQGEKPWAEILFDVLQIRAVVCQNLGRQAMERLDEVVSYLNPQLGAGTLAIDHTARALEFRHDILYTDHTAQESVLSQLDAFMMVTVVTVALFFTTLFSVAYEDMDTTDALEEIVARSNAASEELTQE